MGSRGHRQAREPGGSAHWTRPSDRHPVDRDHRWPGDADRSAGLRRGARADAVRVAQRVARVPLLSRPVAARFHERVAERPSDITGHVTFDLALELGRHFPRGAYTFDGPHAMYMSYAADNLKARGRITASDVLVADATASAYGARVTTGPASIGIDAPF